MPKLIILGASNAIPTRESDNAHMVLVGSERVVLVDCASNPVLRLEQAGLDLNDLTDIVVTHFHPDHVSGLPLLLMNMWLMGRRESLNIYGLNHALDRVEDLMGFYGWEDWPGFFQVAFIRLPAEEHAAILECADFNIYASPVRHVIPNIGLRVEFPGSSSVLTYSSDTEPCEQVVRLAAGADVLIHEATGASIGHSSASQAGEIAARAEVGSLYLIHYPTGRHSRPEIIDEARSKFQGNVALATDFLALDFSKNNK